MFSAVVFGGKCRHLQGLDSFAAGILTSKQQKEGGGGGGGGEKKEEEERSKGTNG